MRSDVYEVVRVDPPVRNTRGHVFRRIVFKPPDYVRSGKVYFCDICEGFRNAGRWRVILARGAGTLVANLRRKDPGHIDADSWPRIVNLERRN